MHVSQTLIGQCAQIGKGTFWLIYMSTKPIFDGISMCYSFLVFKIKILHVTNLSFFFKSYCIFLVT